MRSLNIITKQIQRAFLVCAALMISFPAAAQSLEDLLQDEPAETVVENTDEMPTEETPSANESKGTRDSYDVYREQLSLKDREAYDKIRNVHNNNPSNRGIR
ncbi:MAG: hypothetical protein GC137_10805 [Alphaproteobacteria bacterium]|nr:hypothetical protein [Alphaproteobacteria bacterium]